MARQQPIFLPAKKNTHIPWTCHNFVLHSVNVTYLALTSSCSGALSWKKFPNSIWKLQSFTFFFRFFYRFFKYEGKSKGIAFNVVGQTGKACLLTWADSVKVADRRNRTHKCQPYFKLPPPVFQNWQQKFSSKVLYRLFAMNRIKKHAKDFEVKYTDYTLRGFGSRPISAFKKEKVAGRLHRRPYHADGTKQV